MHKVLQRYYSTERERQADCHGFDRGFLFGILIGAAIAGLAVTVASYAH